MVKRSGWLSLTPEPERELPQAVATLTAGRSAQAGEIARERGCIERLIVRHGLRRWLAYLHRVVELIDARAGDGDPDVRRARARALAVVANHHALLLGVPGPGARLSAADRRRLEAASARGGNARTGRDIDE